MIVWVLSHCNYIDLQERYLLPQARTAVLTVVKGACSGRENDEAFTLGPGPGAGTAIPFSQLNNTLSGSSCIALLVNTRADNVQPLMVFYDQNQTELGSIVLTQSTVNITIRDSFATFDFPDQSLFDHTRLQLCMDGETLDVYHNCLLIGSQNFVNVGFQESDVIGLLRHLVMVNADPFLVCIVEINVYVQRLFSLNDNVTENICLDKEGSIEYSHKQVYSSH